MMSRHLPTILSNDLQVFDGIEDVSAAIGTTYVAIPELVLVRPRIRECAQSNNQTQIHINKLTFPLCVRDLHEHIAGERVGSQLERG